MTGPVYDWVMAHYHDYDATPAGRNARIAACVTACRTTRKYASTVICRLEREGLLTPLYAAATPTAPATPTPAAPESTPPVGISEEALRARIDVHYMARRFLDGIPAGMFYGLDEAAAECGLARDTARAVFMDPRYESYRGQAIADRRTYLGHPDRIAAMKQERIMR